MKFKIFSTLLALALLVPAVAGASENSKSNDEEYHKDSPYVNADGEYDIEAHRSQRGLVKLDNAVVPKGQWIIGANASYSNHINKDYTLAIVNGISSTGYSIDVSPIIAYTIKSNMSVGVRFAYSRSLLNLDSAMLSIGDEDTAVEIEADDYYALEQTYTGMAIFRQYIPLGNSKRFSLFSEIRMEYGGVRAKYAYDQTTDSDYPSIRGTFSKGYNVGVSIVPGIVAWATNDVAFEVSVGVVGLSYSHREQVHNQVNYGEVNTSQLSYGLNIFSIGLGVAFYL